MKRKWHWMAMAIGWAFAAGAAEPDLDALVHGNLSFLRDLHGQLRSQPGNLFYSPYSLSSALAMTYAGAGGNTAAEMQKTLHFTLGEKTHSAFSALKAALEELQKDGAVQLRIANSLWPLKGYPFLPAFLERVKSGYGAEIVPLDFIGATEESRQTINRWVEDETRDKIKELIAPGNLDPLVRLVLVNAIYFKGNWARPFNPEQTVPAEFFVAPDVGIPVPMMAQTHRFPFAEFEDFQIVRLPYAGGGLSMLVILPKERDGLGKVEDQLAPERVRQWRERLTEREVRVYLPKFKMTWGAAVLNSPLRKLGMVDAFDAARADFSGMDGRPNGLFVGLVLHKAFVEVNEEGTEAAAATAVIMRVKSMPLPPVEFRADRPFLFLIQEEQTGAILFLGRVADPSKTE